MDDAFNDFGKIDGSSDSCRSFLEAHPDLSFPKFFHAALLRVGADNTTFYASFAKNPTDLVQALTESYFALLGEKLEATDRLFVFRGYLAMAALTMELMQEGQRIARGRAEFTLANASMSELRKKMFVDVSVRQALFVLYAPAARPGGSALVQETELAKVQWEEIRKPGVRISFHRRGTTSFILRVDAPYLGQYERLALKCIIYPYTDVAPIIESTETYYRYRTDGAEFMPTIRSSSDKWIMMDFIEGRPLSDFGPGLGITFEGLRLSTYKRIITLLLQALAELEEKVTAQPGHKLGHWDLAPSNIIAVMKPDSIFDEPALGAAPDADIERLVLVDLGPNHLYSRSLGMLEGAETVFIAPEVKDENTGLESSDLFSLAMIIVWLSEERMPTAAVVSDRLYQRAAPLARLVEDLLDVNADRRLLLFSSVLAGPGRYQRLAAAINKDIEILERADQLAPADERYIRALVDLYKLREPRRQFTLFWEGRKNTGDTIIGNAGWLFFWSALCSANWYLTTTVITVWAFRDVGIETFALPVDIANRVFGTEGLPGIDSLRAPGYELGATDKNIQALVLAFSFTLVATKYYQSIYSRIRVAPATGVLAHAAEFAMRFNAVWVGGPILVAVLVQPAWWPWCAAVGYFGTMSNDYCSHRFTERALKLGRKEFSSIPDHINDVMRSYGEWWRIMLIYAFILSFLAYGLTSGKVQDWNIYAGLIVLVNLAKLYPSNCSRLAPTVRGMLARSFVVSERLDALSVRRSSSGTGAKASVVSLAST